MNLEKMTIKDIARKYNIDISKYNYSQLVKGYNVELEHYKNPETRVVKNAGDVIKIVIAHLQELPDYYDKLEKIESNINEAAYIGNIGLVELFKFWEIATDSDKKKMIKYIDKNDKNSVWQLLKRVTGVTLF